MISADDLKRVRKLNLMFQHHRDKRCTLLWRVAKMAYPQFVDDTHPVKTAAVAMIEGRINYFWNRSFFDKLSIVEVGFVAAHETLHVILDHCVRRGKRRRKEWNEACDILVNETLENQYGLVFRTGANLKKRIRAGMYNITIHKALQSTVEQLYDLIMQRKQQQQDADNGQSDVNDRSINGVPKSESMPSTLPGGNEDGRSHSDNAEPLDQHDDWDEQLTDELAREAVRRVVAETFNEDKKNAETLIGSRRSKRRRGMQYGFGTSGEFVRLTEKFVRPFPWQSLMRNRLASVHKPNEGDNWSRCHRKMYSCYPTFMLPGTHENEQQTSSILLSIDASGSMSEDNIADMVALVRSLPPDTYDVVETWFDDAVWQAKDLGQARGRGGTSFQRIEDVAQGFGEIKGYTAEENRVLARYPDVVVVMTDGLAPRPTIKHPERWIWLVAPHGNTKACSGLGTVWHLTK